MFKIELYSNKSIYDIEYNYSLYSKYSLIYLNTTQKFAYICSNQKTFNMKAIIYARVSSTTDRQNTDRQIVDLKAYAQYAKIEIVKTFNEHVSGAKKNNERPILIEAIEYCLREHIDMLLVSELSRLGRNAFEVLEVIKTLVDSRINLYMQKEQFLLLEKNGKPSIFAPIMIATLSTCAQLERENIKFRLNSGRQLYIEKGGKLGRKEGSVKPKEKRREEYKEVIRLLKKGISIRNVAKITNKSISTVQRVKKDFIP